MSLEPREDRSGRSHSRNLGSENHRSHSRAFTTRDASRAASTRLPDVVERQVMLDDREREREREREDARTVPEVLRGRYVVSDAPTYDEQRGMSLARTREPELYEARDNGVNYPRPTSPTITSPSMVSVPHSNDSRELRGQKSPDGSGGKGSGASISIDVGKHSLVAGIHFGKSLLDKRSPRGTSPSPTRSKSSKENHLAYGSFYEDRLAHPDPPNKNYEESSQRALTRHDETLSNPQQRYYSSRYDQSSNNQVAGYESSRYRNPSSDPADPVRHSFYDPSSSSVNQPVRYESSRYRDPSTEHTGSIRHSYHEPSNSSVNQAVSYEYSRNRDSRNRDISPITIESTRHFYNDPSGPSVVQVVSYESSRYPDPSPDPIGSVRQSYHDVSGSSANQANSYEYNRPRDISPIYTDSARYTSYEPSSSVSRATPRESSRRRDLSPDVGSLSRQARFLSIDTENSAEFNSSNLSGSPLLEPYRGIYQTVSPIPSPLLTATRPSSPEYLEPLSPSSSADEYRNTNERHQKRGRSSSKKPRRKARFHDPKEEASILAETLREDTSSPDTAPLISILPGLTHAQTLDLRAQYKKLVKTGREKKESNVAKHIKHRLKSQPNLMNVCYACALGRWESEAFWINYWCKYENSRKELLIESLMGRTNEEIRAIKKGFRDKLYDHDLVKCMRGELRDDKFKKAILLVLEEKRMEERASGSVDRKLVDSDVKDLRKAIKKEKSGESAIIEIVVLRSDTHLREVLKAYRKEYGVNLAKAVLKKSGNLVGELLAHILNGVINIPVRDALLLHHALSLSSSDPLRAVLLSSRLVRYHWNRPHLEHVRTEFRHMYSQELQKAVENGVSGDYGAFLEALCVRRVEDDVRVVER